MVKSMSEAMSSIPTQKEKIVKKPYIPGGLNDFSPKCISFVFNLFA